MNKTVIRRSERIYGFLLKFYPKSYRQEFAEEMKYVFSASLKDVYAQNNGQGVLDFWKRTLLDTGKSLVTQHRENRKGGGIMKNKNTSLINSNRIFAWIALATGLILLVPLFAMKAKTGVDWDETDFIIIGTLLFGMGSLFVFVARKITKRSHRIVAGILFLLAIMYMWAELAVGIFTNLGS